jgi:hypothetical protein
LVTYPNKKQKTKNKKRIKEQQLQFKVSLGSKPNRGTDLSIKVAGLQILSSE